jgi:hypothetical protein
LGIIFLKHKLRAIGRSEENIKMQEENTRMKEMQSRETFSRKKRWSRTEC